MYLVIFDEVVHHVVTLHLTLLSPEKCVNNVDFVLNKIENLIGGH
jgi:hypothetical protein